MYLNWSYLPISDEYYLLNSISFLLPRKAELLLDTFFIAGLSIFFFGFKKNSNIKYLLILLFLISTLIVVNSNFQSRWYLMFYVLFILSFDTFYSQTHKDFFVKIVRYNFFFINSFFIYYLIAVLFFFIFLSIEGAKERLIYLYKETKNINLLSQNYYVLTNSRSNFFLNNSIGYNNSKYFNNLLINNHENYNIKYGLFFIGHEINKTNYILASFDKKCFETKQIIESEIKKRNFLSRRVKEYYILVEFKKNPSTCIIQ
jgi:signal transduction histidine kinase